MPEFICSTCGKRVPGDGFSAGSRVLCPACMAATAIATPEDAAVAKITTRPAARDGSFRQGAPLSAPVEESLERQALRGALIFAAAGIGGAFIGSPFLFCLVAGQAAKSEGEVLMIMAIGFGPGILIGALFVGILLRNFDRSYAGRVPLAGPAAFLVGALLGIPLAGFASQALEFFWLFLIALILANATYGAFFGAIRYLVAARSAPKRPRKP